MVLPTDRNRLLSYLEFLDNFFDCILLSGAILRLERLRSSKTHFVTKTNPTIGKLPIRM